LLPSWNEAREQLLAPILTANPDYFDLYWRAWELAFAHLRQPTHRQLDVER